MRTKRLLRRMFAGAAAGFMAFSLVAAAVPASAAKDKKKAKEVDLNGTYHAALGVQTATDLWIMRMAYYDKSQNDYYKTDDADKMLCQNKETQKMEAQPGKFTDVEIKGNGTYTVSLEGGQFSGETILSQLHVATDIPMNDTIKFSDVSATINGKTIAEFDEGFMEYEEAYLRGGMVFLILNHWRADLVQALNGKGLSEDNSNGYTLLQGSGDENISVTFTVSGFAYDNPDAQQQTEETVEEGNTDGADEAGNATAEDSTAEKANEGGSGTTVVIVLIIVAVIAVVAIAMGVSRKKKN